MYFIVVLIYISQKNGKVGHFKVFGHLNVLCKVPVQDFAHFVNIEFSPSYLFVGVFCIEMDSVIKNFPTLERLGGLVS